ncbi:Mob1/phocein [Irpex rosettiformis]|uniref:Mob1/phocein n=1 Tax=Irpex rosettiformis TaxID=378272 RepID=A0ACB8U4H4_9APHY|nr:Mob1/phocein [Irpex rosettiformis]
MTVIQRPLKGSRISSFYPVKSLPPLSALDSAFQLQEYISLLIRCDVHDVEAIVSLPGPLQGVERESNDEDKNTEKDGKAEVTVDESCWVYEQLRRLAQDLTHPLITTLQHECTRQTCPQMKAGEWLYLCVAHGNDGAMEQCCAIDYILHTLDSATALLNSPRAFPSRLSIPPTSTRHFSSLARRLGRIFAHAYYHHREAFEQAEAESSLYARFLALTSKFNLVPSEFLVIPPRMASLDDETERDEPGRGDLPGLESQHQDPRQWLSMSDSSSVVNLSTGGSSSPNSDIARTASPRKVGRSRTDTMVYSEAANVAEELARSETFSTEDLDRAIAAERMLSAVPQSLQDEQSSSAEDTSFYSSSQENVASDPELDASEELEPEIHLDLSAPPPTEPPIPMDVDDQLEEDITEESTAAASVVPAQAEAESEAEMEHGEPMNEPVTLTEESTEQPAPPEDAVPSEAEPPVAPREEKEPEDITMEDISVEETEAKEVGPSESEEPVTEADVVEHAKHPEEETAVTLSENEVAEKDATIVAPATISEESV